MKLRSYIPAISLLSLTALFSMPAVACGPEPYLPYTFAPFMVIDPLKVSYEGGSVNSQNETLSFWHDYTNGNVSMEQVKDYFANASSDNPYPHNHSALIDYLEGTNDQTAIQYIADCMEFNDLTHDYQSSGWDYTERDPRDLRMFASLIEKRKGGKIFSPRYNLLKMRIAGLLRDDEKVMKIWKSSGLKMAPGALRDRMGGFVGGVLYRQGNYPEALDYFTASGDQNSIAWCVSKLLGPANLRRLYQHDPNSNATMYVLNDYLDFLISRTNAGRRIPEPGIDESDDELLEALRNRNEFITLCDEVLADGQSNNPMAWALAKGAVELTLGKYSQGLSTLQQAKRLKGNETTHNTLDNFEVWALLLNSGKGNEDIDRQMISSLKKIYHVAEKESILKMRNRDRHNNPTPEQTYTFLTTFFREEAQCHFMQLRQPARALAILAMMEDLPDEGSGLNQREMREMIFRSLSDTEALSFIDLAQKGGTSALDSYFTKYASKYLNLALEAYGTRLLVRNDFEGALKYLNEVDLKWLPSMAIYPYLRRYQGAYYYNFHRDHEGKELWTPYYPSNEKAAFCSDMISELKNYNSLAGDKKALAAYNIASLYHMGSPAGDCWAISDYSWSSTQRANKFNTEAAKWLKNAWYAASDPELKCKISYAILANPEFNDQGEALFAFGKTGGYDEPERYYWDNRTALNERAISYLVNHYSIVRDDYYMSQCDVLSDYAASRFVAKPKNYYSW